MICELCDDPIGPADPVQSFGLPPDSAIVHADCARKFRGGEEA